MRPCDPIRRHFLFVLLILSLLIFGLAPAAWAQSGPSATVYYGTVRTPPGAPLSYKYTTNRAELVSGSSLTIGKGWISNGSFTPDRTVASGPVYYGWKTFRNSTTAPVTQGERWVYTTVANEITNPRNGLYSRVRLSDGWLEGWGGMTPDKSKPSVQIWYTYKTFINDPYPGTSPKSDTQFRYTTDPATVIGDGSYVAMSYGWTNSSTSITADQTRPSGTAYYAWKRFTAYNANTQKSDAQVNQFVYTNSTANIPQISPVLLSNGWIDGATQYIPDTRVAAREVYYGAKTFSIFIPGTTTAGYYIRNTQNVYSLDRPSSSYTATLQGLGWTTDGSWIRK